jgi:hypothetical protein
VPGNVRLEIETELEALTRELTDRRPRAKQLEVPEQVTHPDCPANVQAIFFDKLVVKYDRSFGAARYEIRSLDPSISDPSSQWAAGDLLGTADDTEFIYTGDASSGAGGVPAALVTDIMVRAVSKHGLYSTCYDAIDVDTIGEELPCLNVAGADAGSTWCYESTSSGTLLVHDYIDITLADFGWKPAHRFAWCYDGKVDGSTDLSYADLYWTKLMDHTVLAGQSFTWGKTVGGSETWWQLQAAPGAFTWVPRWLETRPNGATIDVQMGVDGAGLGTRNDASHALKPGMPGLIADPHYSPPSSCDNKTGTSHFRRFRCYQNRVYTLEDVPQDWETRFIRSTASGYDAETQSKLNSAGSSVYTMTHGYMHPFATLQVWKVPGFGQPSTMQFQWSTVPGGIWGGDIYRISTAGGQTAGTTSTGVGSTLGGEISSGGYIKRIQSGFYGRDEFSSTTLTNWTEDGGSWVVSTSSGTLGGSPNCPSGSFIRFSGGAGIPTDEIVIQADMKMGSSIAAELYMAQMYPKNALRTSIDIEFLDINSSGISTSTGVGLFSTAYSRGHNTVLIPAGAVYINPLGRKHGAQSTGEVCLRDLQINFGSKCCAYNPPQSGLPNLPGLQNLTLTASSFDSCTGTSTGKGHHIDALWTFSTALIGSSTIAGNTTCCGSNLCTWQVELFVYEDGVPLTMGTDYAIDSTCTGNKSRLAVGAGAAADDQGGVTIILLDKSSTVSTTEHVIGAGAALWNVGLHRGGVNATDILTSYGDCP